MSRSIRATRYAPPPGFVIATSRDPGIEVYAPATTIEVRLCAGCGAHRTDDPCLRCGTSDLLVPVWLRATLDREEAVERARIWLSQVVRPAPEALVAVDRLQPLDVPCGADGGTLGVLPPLTLCIPETPESPDPAEEVPALPPLERPLPTPAVYVMPVFAASFERDGRTGWVVVDAVDGTVHGDRPVDARRLRLHALFGLLPGLSLGFCMGTPALLLAGFGLLVWGAALILILLGHARWARLERQAYEAERW